MRKKVAIVQSSYIPWKGYFDLIRFTDEFILFDDVQFTRRDWRSRNQIKSQRGMEWLSIPVSVKGKYLQLVRDTEISEPGWNLRHWKVLQHCYARAAHFQTMRPQLESLYVSATQTRLSDVNHHFLTGLCDVLGIRTPLTRSSDYEIIDGKTERLLRLCQCAGATDYLSGPSAAAYLDESKFRDGGIAVTYMNYSGYPEYRQPPEPFAHNVSVLDLLFHEGPDAAKFLLSPGPFDRL